MPTVLENPNLLQADAFQGPANNAIGNLSIRCPHCRNIGSFGVAGNGYVYRKYGRSSEPTQRIPFEFLIAIRVCPNNSCNGMILTTHMNGSSQASLVLPPELLDFSTDNIPEAIASALTEAIACHGSGAFRASAIMVRRVLEMICEENKATGKTLHDRLNNLKSTLMIHRELFDAMMELKILGNDAAHVESKAYDDISKDEATAGIELIKEILKSLYQLKHLTGLLTRLKKVEASDGA